MDPSRNRRKAAPGLATRIGRIGAIPVRLVMAPARAVGWSPRAVVRSGVGSVTASAGGVLETEAGRAVDMVMAGPLPEAVARSLVDRRVVERVVTELLARGDLERMVTSATADKRTEQLVQQVISSPATERLLGDALESRMTLELSDRLLRNPELQRVVEAAVLAGLASQTTTLADNVAAGAHRADAILEAPPRRWVRRPARPPAPAGGEPAVPHAGLASRAAALIVDSVIVHAGFLIGCALFAVAERLVGRSASRGAADAFAGVAWTLMVGTYFVAFWTAAGQTPGMRLLRLRVSDGAGASPRFGRSLLRLLGSAVTVAFIFIGFLPVLFDDRRRALQDFVAGTVVLYDPRHSLVDQSAAIDQQESEHRTSATEQGSLDPAELTNPAL